MQGPRCPCSGAPNSSPAPLPAPLQPQLSLSHAMRLAPDHCANGDGRQTGAASACHAEVLSNLPLQPGQACRGCSRCSPAGRDTRLTHSLTRDAPSRTHCIKIIECGPNAAAWEYCGGLRAPSLRDICWLMARSAGSCDQPGERPVAPRGAG